MLCFSESIVEPCFEDSVIDLYRLSLKVFLCFLVITPLEKPISKHLLLSLPIITFQRPNRSILPKHRRVTPFTQYLFGRCLKGIIKIIIPLLLNTINSDLRQIPLPRLDLDKLPQLLLILLNKILTNGARMQEILHLSLSHLHFA